MTAEKTAQSTDRIGELLVDAAWRMKDGKRQWIVEDAAYLEMLGLCGWRMRTDLTHPAVEKESQPDKREGQ